MTTTYGDFIARKAAEARRSGVTVARSDIHPTLHEWQAELVAWAADVGRAAIWADTGLGKTFMQVEWARAVSDPFDGTTLIVAPLAVCEQTIREAAKLGVHATYVRHGDDIIDPGLYITNYEMASRFDPERLTAVVLDEASILKQSDGATRTMLIRHFADVPFRLSCTATPAPNDPEELTNQAEFLGHSTRVNMLAAYFVHDDDGWRLKGHARRPMFRWMSTWAVAVRRPSDLGYPDDGYVLPGLEIIPHLLPVNATPEDQLFATDLGGIGGRAKVRRDTLVPRCEAALALVSTDWQPDSAKLATWDGNQSMQPIAEPSISPTLTSESAGRRKAVDPIPTASTCGPTTRPTKTDSSSTNGIPPNVVTPGAENGTHPIRTIGLSACGSPSSETLSPSATLACAEPSASPHRSMTPRLSANAEAVESADRQSVTSRVVDLQLTTATARAEYGASSAANATSASASSETTPTYSLGPSSTSASPEPWLIWVGLNDEQEYIAAALGDQCFSVTGSMSPEEKADRMLRWIDGERPILVTKPQIAGYGMNFQHCARMVFVGLSDSYETYYQSIRRCYRYGQARVVHAHVVLSELEAQVAANVARKERDAAGVVAELVTEMQTARKETRA